MARWQRLSKRKISGGRYHLYRKKKLRELGGYPAETKIAEYDKRKEQRIRGGSLKYRLIFAHYANVYDPKSGVSKRVEIIDLEHNPASRDFTRRRIVTKGAIIKTELGLARVTSRPGQHGIVNAVLIKEEEQKRKK